jgi:type II secretory pathway component HofQ
MSQDGRTALIGGIIQQTDNNGNQASVLRKIPLLPSVVHRRQNFTRLIVAITPHVVKQGSESLAVLELKQLRQ